MSFDEKDNDLFDKEFLKNFPFGVFVGAMIVLMLCWVFDADIREDMTKLYTFIFSALIGLLAASVALSGVLASLQHQSTLREEERKRKLSAARAFLPQALSDMCEVARSGMLNAHTAGVKQGNELESTFVSSSLNDIRLNDEVVSVFKDIIEFSDANAGRRIQGILSEHQVLQARWSGYVRDKDNMLSPNASDLAQRICHWAFLYALTATAFPYARQETNDVEVSVDEGIISSTLRTVGIYLNEDDSDLLSAIGLYARHFQRQHNFK